MQKHYGMRLYIEDIRQTAGMVKVAVTQHDGIGGFQGDIEAAGIILQDIALTRIEEDVAPGVFDPKRQPVFRQERLPGGGVFDDNRNARHD